jgi:Spy/CpxP family protein refolding chaperone
MKRAILFILTALLSPLMVTEILCQTNGAPTAPKVQPAMQFPAPPGFADLKQALGLTDAQLMQLQNLQRSRQAASQAVYQQVAAKQKQINDMLNSPAPDAATLGQLEIDMANLRKQAGAMPPIHDQALAILDDAQRAKLTDLQNALKLQRAAGEAVGLGLLEPPAPAVGRMGALQQ